MSIIYDEGENFFKVTIPAQIKDEDFVEIANSLKEKGDVRDFKLDLRNVAYMYSKNVAALINLKKIATEKGINFIFTI